MFVQAIIGRVTPSDTATDVALNCEMAFYIHPDTDFLWMRGGQRIDPNDKYDIIYSDGGRDGGQIGGTGLVRSRLSALVVKNFEPFDDGNYTCFVDGTDESAIFQLNINDPGKLERYSTYNTCVSRIPFHLNTLSCQQISMAIIIVYKISFATLVFRYLAVEL